MKRLLFFLLACLSFGSCSYVMEVEMPEFTPKIVLNSFISPDEKVSVGFSWSRSATGDDEKSAPISGSATLFENDIEIATVQLSSEQRYSFAFFDYTPLVGCTYRVVAAIDSYGEVSAETYIPESCALSAEIVKEELIEDFNYMDTAGVHFKIDDIALCDEVRSLWFYTYGRTLMTASEEVRIENTNYGILFCDNPYIDNMNRAEEVDLTGENIYLEYRTGDPMYYGALRLAEGDIDKRESFKVASEYVYQYGDDEVSEYLTHVRVIAISPSDDFDRYQKSAYQQANGVYYFDMTPISFDEVRVYSNVKNGLGIFAGYNQTIVDMPVTNFSEEE